MTDPFDSDTDGDLMPDGWEVQYGFDPTDITDAALDADVNGFTNLQEFNAETDPLDPNDPPREEPTDDEGNNPGIPGYSLVVILGGCISLTTLLIRQILRKIKT